MEVIELEIAVHEWTNETKGERPSVIAINPETFDILMSDKDATKHIELYEDEGRIIGHKFNGIPMMIMNDVETYKIYSKEEHEEEIKRERNKSSEWDGPYSYHEALIEWAENDKTIMYQFESSGIPFDRSVMSGGIPTTHNISKGHILKAKWYIEK